MAIEILREPGIGPVIDRLKSAAFNGTCLLCGAVFRFLGSDGRLMNFGYYGDRGGIRPIADCPCCGNPTKGEPISEQPST